MRFFDSIRRLLPSSSSGNPQNRWEFTFEGTCRDTLRENSAVWRVGVSRFESWLQGLEKRTESSLGRRLAHAALEHEERFLGMGRIARPSGHDPSSWADYTRDWEARGLGRFRLLDDEKDIRVLVEGPASGPICAGMVAAAWECATGKRHRFTWSDSSNDGLVVSLFEQHSQLPGPKSIAPPWMPTTDSSKDEQDADHWADLLLDGKGTWSIIGERKMMLHLDLVARFEEYCTPYLEAKRFQRSEDYEWSGLDDQSSAWWDAAADSAREGFVTEGHHVLVRDHTDWISIARRHLSSHGLGGLSVTKQTDSHGGVLLNFCDVFHPAIASGILLGCWERAHGRNGRAITYTDSGETTLELLSSRAIAD